MQQFVQTDMDGAAPPETASQAVAAARKGDHRGWNWLFDTYYPLVHRYVYASVGRSAGAEVDDVAQEVFVAAVGSIRHLRGESATAVEGWLLGIARNKAIDCVRRAARRQRVNAGPAVANGGDDPGAIVVAQGGSPALLHALQALSKDQRDVVVRRFVLDQSLDHVAATTGRSLGTVKALQHRGIAALRRILGEGELIDD